MIGKETVHRIVMEEDTVWSNMKNMLVVTFK